MQEERQGVSSGARITARESQCFRGETPLIPRRPRNLTVFGLHAFARSCYTTACGRPPMEVGTDA